MPESLNIDPLQNYFGEKIALYFLFIKKFAKNYKYFGIICIPVFIADYVLLKKQNVEQEKGNEKFTDYTKIYHHIRIIFTLVLVIGNTIFLEYWKREQKNQAIRFGQLDAKQKEDMRPDFSGRFERDLADNTMNLLYYSPFKRKLKVIFGVCVSLFLIICSVIVTLAIMFLQELMFERKLAPIVVSIVPPLLNMISAKFFTFIYDRVSKWLNYYENHKYLSEYEDTLIWKIFLFNLFNNFNPIFILAFVKIRTTQFGRCQIKPGQFSVLNIEGVPLGCYNELINYVSTFMVTKFVMSIVKLLVAWILSLIKKKFIIKREYDWGDIDHVIEQEWEKTSYQTTLEVDGVLNDYLAIVLSFSFLSMFGQVFPMGFLLGFFALAAEMQVNKKNLIYFMKRPTPKGAQDIGSWENILEMMSYAAIVVNCYVLTFTSDSVDIIVINYFSKNIESLEDFQYIAFLIFTVLIIGLLAIKKICAMCIDDIPRQTQEILDRQTHIKQRLEFDKIGNKTFFRSGYCVGKWTPEEAEMVVNTTELYYNDGNGKEEQSEAMRSVMKHNSYQSVQQKSSLNSNILKKILNIF